MNESTSTHDQTKTETLTVSVPISAVCIDSNPDSLIQACLDYRVANLYPYLEGLGIQLRRCQGSSANRDTVAAQSKIQGVHYLTGVGHGTPDTFTGYEYFVVYSCGNYSNEEVTNKIAHFVACRTALQLGPDFVTHGCRAYFGYDADFLVQLDEIETFMYCDSEIDRALAEGATAAEAHERAIAQFNNYIDQYRRLNRNSKAARLQYNRDHLCSPVVSLRWGDPTARLYA